MQLLRLKEVMKSKGVSGKELAHSVDVSPNSITNIVQGNTFPKPELLQKIAQILDVDIRELFIPSKAAPTDTETLYVKRNGEFIPIGTLKKEY